MFISKHHFFLAVVALFIVTILVAVFLYSETLSTLIDMDGWSASNDEELPPKCSEEALICPDGSFVVRDGPLCEFPKCPVTDKILFSSETCKAKGGRILNTLSGEEYNKADYLGEIVGMRCPCICVKEEAVEPKKIEIIFQKEAWWGPCPKEGTCTEFIQLTSAGVLTRGTRNKMIETESVDTFVKAIKDSGIMEKNCTAPLVLDYGATYTIFDGSTGRSIEFPGCDEELRNIEALLQPLLQGL